MIKPLSKRRLFLLLGAFAGMSALAINNGLFDERRALAQMSLWTFLVFTLAAIQVHESLHRPRQVYVALALICLHVLGLMKMRRYFPLDNILVGLIGIAVEAVILIFLYARIGQSIDPKGPFGMTEAETRARHMKRYAARDRRSKQS